MLEAWPNPAAPEEANVANEQQQDNMNEQAVPSLSKHGAARRRLAKAGVGAAGILWTLESKATYQQGMVCSAPSGSLSTGLQSTYAAKATCQGLAPDTWAKLSGSWPCSDKVKFKHVFPCSGSTMNTYGNATMLELLGGQTFDTYGLGAELVATYLNVLSKKISFLTEHDVIDMWTQIQRGSYKATPKVSWNAQELKYYLASTHH